MFEAAPLRTATVFALLVLTSCSEPRPATTASQIDLVWPSPPLTPRIRFVQTLSAPGDAGIERGIFDKFVKFIKGAPERRMSNPYGLFKDDAERLYVVDTSQKAVQVFDSANGDHYWFPDDPLEGFENPIDVVADGSGRVYVSDSMTNVIHVFEDYGKRHVTTIGRGVLQRPTGLAIDRASGRLLVVDTIAGQVVVFDPPDWRASMFVGRKGDEQETFNFPASIAISDDGMVFVTDAMNFRVQVLNPDLTFLRSFGQAGDSPGNFSRPKGVAVDSDGHVYVVDALFDNIQIFDQEGRLLLAFGSPGAGPGQFWLPNEIFIDKEDRIYVSDAYNRRVQVFQYLKQGSRP